MNGGKLKNVFIWITRGVDEDLVPPLSGDPHYIDQQSCIYRPRVSGARVGQWIEVRNTDPVAHNVHVRSSRNGEPNSAQL